MKTATEMTVDEFARHLTERREKLFNLTPQYKGKNNRSYANKVALFASASVKLAMQRRRGG